MQTFVWAVSAFKISIKYISIKQEVELSNISRNWEQVIFKEAKLMMGGKNDLFLLVLPACLVDRFTFFF